MLVSLCFNDFREVVLVYSTIIVGCKLCKPKNFLSN